MIPKSREIKKSRHQQVGLHIPVSDRSASGQHVGGDTMHDFGQSHALRADQIIVGWTYSHPGETLLTMDNNGLAIGGPGTSSDPTSDAHTVLSTWPACLAVIPCSSPSSDETRGEM
jgi:hypothetical protein